MWPTRSSLIRKQANGACSAPRDADVADRCTRPYVAVAVAASHRTAVHAAAAYLGLYEAFTV